MKKTIATAAVLAALALTGCTAGNQSAAPEPIVTATPSASAPAAEQEPTVAISGASDKLKVWVEESHDSWVDFYLPVEAVGSSHSIFVTTEDGGAMWARNLEWSAPRVGELVITIKGNGWTEHDLYMVSGYVMGVLGLEDDSLKSVTAVSEDGQTTSKADRRSEGL